MKILIAYATKTGTTATCAALLAKDLPRCEVDIINIADETPNFEGYDLLIFGASIRMGRLDKRMYAFLEKNKDSFRGKKTAYFICCGFDNESEKYFLKAFPKLLIENSFAYDSFGGELKLDKQRGIDKLIVKMILKSNEENDEFVMPTIFTEAISRFADKIKNMNT